MEAAGAAASLLTLLSAAKEAYVLSDALYRGLRNAKQEMRIVRDQLGLIRAFIELLRGLESQKVYDILSLASDQKEIVANAIENARVRLEEVQQTCAGRVVCDGKRAHLRWAFHDRAYVKDILTQLQFVQITLNGALVTLNLVVTTNVAAQLQTLPTIILHKLREVQLHQTQVEQQQSTQLTASDVLPHGNDLPVAQRLSQDTVVYHPSRKPLGWLEWYTGIEVVLASAESPDRSDLRVFMKFPLPGLARRHIFVMDVSLASHDSRSFRIDRSHIGISNVVPYESAIVQACEKGDLLWVQKLFNGRMASVNDYTPDGRRILRHAIKSGSAALIEFLLCHGADATALSGDRNAGLLQGAFFHRQADIARLLIRERADVDHIGFDRYTPVFNLFNEGEYAGPCDEFLEILATNDFRNINIQSTTGWTALHRAAAWCTADDVNSLIQCGASTELYTTGLHWTPIFQAVRYNNLNTFEALLAVEAADITKNVDNRGWTLLHVAAFYGSFDLMLRLVQLGADPQAKSSPSTVCVPPALRNVELSPEDLARHRGPDEYRRYIQVLQRGGHDVVMDDQGEVYWMTSESVESES